MSQDLLNTLQNILERDVAPIPVPAAKDIHIEEETIDMLLNSMVTANEALTSEEIDHAAVDELLSDFVLED
ncbi:hypothetical protein [Candidatus Berkiella aquae]|uniref:Uncharacterized protein n=1 Tax=Candidatus Berkiella aquae TaxID=295108 RepID=A0A0Q9YC31_9GAMM|nr:hypothetical protein [Candidatus Berkiella aquae]MCS5711040.1 hypothetical protein [Candidatus Berkiella aquae]